MEFKKDPYTKMSMVISIEIFVLMCINFLLKIFIKNFDELYIIIAQISLLNIQFVGIILQQKHYKNRKTFEEPLHPRCRHSIIPYIEDDE